MSTPLSYPARIGTSKSVRLVLPALIPVYLGQLHRDPQLPELLPWPRDNPRARCSRSSFSTVLSHSNAASRCIIAGWHQCSPVDSPKFSGAYQKFPRGSAIAMESAHFRCRHQEGKERPPRFALD